MSRVFLSFAVAALLAWPAAGRLVYGGGPPIDPGALGQQVQAKAVDGQIVITRSQMRMVYETQTRTETRTRTVEVDGEKREETVTAEVPVTIAKTVPTETQQKVPLKTAQAYDMQGKRIEEDQLADALKEERTILLATRKVPRYYLTVYKPDTVLLVIAPQDLYGSPPSIPPAPLAPGVVPPKIDAPRTLPAPTIPAPGEAPPKPDAAPKPAAPRTLPAPALPAPGEAPPKLDAPRTLPAPTVPAPPGDAPAREAPGAVVLKEGASLATAPSLEPQVSMARIVDDKLGLRRYVKDLSSETAMREVEAKGVKKLQAVQIEVETIFDVERKYPQDLLKIYRTDKKPLADDELEKLKENERCVLVSSDGKEVDARYLKIVKPEALIVIAPVTPNQSQLGLPVPLLTPIGAPPPPLPLPTPVPMPPDP